LRRRARTKSTLTTRCASASPATAPSARRIGPLSKSRSTFRAVREAPVEAVLLIDCATLWVSSLMWEHRGQTAAAQEMLIPAQVDDLILASRRSEGAGEIIIVSNEVGGGLAPEHPVGRAFRDLQGFANQRLARAADKVVFIVAGLPLTLKQWGRLMDFEN
jgi:adenosylcobinamide kinase / adenosylcobinamide-phosphate guanylyltransferase